jgi:sarcosine oxidase subunit gamma
VHHWLETHGTQWKHAGGALIATRLGPATEEDAAARELALCDLSGLAKLGVRGPQADAWLRRQGLDVPTDLYDTRDLPDGGLLARIGADQFLLESGVSAETVAALAEPLGTAPGTYRVERQEATFLLAGQRLRQVLPQTCGIDFGVVPLRRLIYTRTAGVNGALLPQEIGGNPACRIWVDPSYAADLWESLVTIVQELGGRVVGAACFYPELSELR